ncbi:MAG: hypothetical protein H8D22_09250, partial [Candidatus Cloacimonetes bacterium]|nr:hypothetical protein [Candidatus Cloacimonadota bacterium]
MNENLKIKVTSDSAQASRDMGGFDSKMKSTIKSVATLAAGMIALKKTYDFLAKSTKMAMEQEKIYKKLETTVNLNGGAWESAEGKLKSYFATLQKTTIYGDTDSAKMLTSLITFSGDYQKSLENLSLAQDMASSAAFNSESAARYLGMAIAGNVEMLGRYVPELKTTNNELLKTMTASEKSEYALKVLQKRFGGLAEDELKTTAGQLVQLNNYWGDMQEAIGDVLLPVLVDVAGFLLKSTKAAMNFFESLTQTSLQRTISELKELGVAVETINKLKKVQLTSEMIALNSKLRETNSEFKTQEGLVKEIEKIQGELAFQTKLYGDAQVKVFENAQNIKGVAADALNTWGGIVKMSKDELNALTEKLGGYQDELSLITSIEVLKKQIAVLDADSSDLQKKKNEDIEKLLDMAVLLENKLYLPVSLKFVEPTEEERESLQEHVDKLYTALPSMEITIDPEYLE